jgi:hypothetical protein
MLSKTFLSTSNLNIPYFISREMIFEKVLLEQKVKEVMPNEGMVRYFHFAFKNSLLCN